MALYINVYFSSLPSSDFLPFVTERLSELGLKCQFPSNLSLRDSGLIPFTLTLKIGPERYKGLPYETGFEIYLFDFDYIEALHEVKYPPKQGWLNKLGIGDQQQEPREFFANKEIDKILEHCRHQLSIRYSDEILTPFAFAAVLAELTDGIIHEGEADEFLKPNEAIKRIPELAQDWDPPWRQD